MEMTLTEFENLRQYIYDVCGIHLSHDKQRLLTTRLMRRLRALKLSSFQTYFEFLQDPKNSEEISNLIDAISTNKTEFFREQKHFDFLTQEVFPLLSKKNNIRIWSAACSSGEEPLTLAMVVLEGLVTAGKDIKILATDISNQILDEAEQATYIEEKTAGIPKPLLQKYFKPFSKNDSTFYSPKDLLKQLIFYKRLNLVKPFPLSMPMDVIFCRNVMIYFDKPTQQQIISRFEQQLHSGGYLFVGHSESLNHITTDLEYVAPTIYRKKGSI